MRHSRVNASPDFGSGITSLRGKALRLVYTALNCERRHPLLKAAIVVLMLALVASLGSGFYFLMLDQGDKEKRRTFHSLGVRLAIAAALMALIIYGLASGRLGHLNPWDAKRIPPATQESTSGNNP
jgi:membrane associated rhomboid family serine protease